MRALALSIVILFALLLLQGCSQKKTNTGYITPNRHKATMRSYTIAGKRYHPTPVHVGQKMRGVASWYGPNFHGKRTSNGEVYNMYAKTAAHKTWPMDTIVEVKNLKTGQKTTVRINDRGPFVAGRIIDCSFAAGKEIGLDKTGLAEVEIKVIGFSGKAASTSVPQQKVLTGNFGVQVGAFRRLEGAHVYRLRYASSHPKYKTMVKRSKIADGEIYRVWMMGFASEEEARDFIARNGLSGASVVRQ